MIRNFRWLAIAGLAASLAAAACGKDEESKDPEPVTNPCNGVTCTGDSKCNPTTGACHCGDGEQICLSGTICVLEPVPTCVSDRCEFTTCTNGQRCDPDDGLCKCDRVACGEGEQCVLGQCVGGQGCEGLVCPAHESCDPDAGSCRCGDGPGCGFGQVCDQGVCRTDNCDGASCGQGLVCNSEDGLCHCGKESGPVCVGGSACVTDEEESRCDGGDPCADAETRCGAGTTCDRADGACRCGGAGPEFPLCADGQVCFDGKCIGGEPCAGVQCGDGMTCDPEDGLCKCGGLFGVTCDDHQVCYQGSSGALCVNRCDPFHPRAGCAEGTGCTFQSDTQGGGIFYCGTVGTVAPGGTCRANAPCQAGYHCARSAGSATDGKCRPYCDLSDRNSCAETEFCTPLDVNTGDVGLCYPRP